MRVSLTDMETKNREMKRELRAKEGIIDDQSAKVIVLQGELDEILDDVQESEEDFREELKQSSLQLNL